VRQALDLLLHQDALEAVLQKTPAALESHGIAGTSYLLCAFISISASLYWKISVHPQTPPLLQQWGQNAYLPLRHCLLRCSCSGGLNHDNSASRFHVVES